MRRINTENRKYNVANPSQGIYKRVLCVCSAGLLRSPTTALVLSKAPYNYNTRAVGISQEYALFPIDEVHIEWADEIVCMEKEHLTYLKKVTKKPIICLDIPDMYGYRNLKLIKLIKERYKKHHKPKAKPSRLFKAINKRYK